MTTTNSSQTLVLMSKQSGIVIIPVGSPLTRLNYFDGKFLRASDLKAEQDYLRQLIQQSNQAGGSGVAHGFDVTLGSGDILNIGPGLAIDPEGRVLLLPQGTSMAIQNLIDKSRDLQQLYGKAKTPGSASFADCGITDEDPTANTTQANSLYLIVISAADALCGEEDVYGRLCEDACATSTDRPFAIEGVVVRAVPLVLKTPLPHSNAAPPTQQHYRSRVASAYFEDERNQVVNLISAEGLKQATWCLGAEAGAGGVPIGVIARAGATTVFLDPWIVRRELIDTPARRYWQWRMMMRPWNVFLAQVLQFQCQLRDLYRNLPDPGVGIDLCGGARDVLQEAQAAISDLRRYYEATSARFAEGNRELILLAGGVNRLTDLNLRLETVHEVLSAQPADRWLINGGIDELPSAGYLPVVPGVGITINQQVQRMMGEGVDLRFCVVRPDYVAHALEEAQHLERISLTAGLDDLTHKPQVDILVPDGEIIEEPKVVPTGCYEAELDLFPHPEVVGRMSAFDLKTDQNTAVPIKGAAHGETHADGGRAAYVAFWLDEKQLSGVTVGSNEGAATPGGLANNAVPARQPTAEVGIWLTIKCDADPMKLTAGQRLQVEVGALVGFNATIPRIGAISGDVEGTSRADIFVNGVTTSSGKTVAQCRVSASGRLITEFTGSQSIKNGSVNFNAEISWGKLDDGEDSAELIVHHPKKPFGIRINASWGKVPKEIEAFVYVTLRRSRETGVPVDTEYKIMRAKFLSNPEVLKEANNNHVLAVKGLQVIGSATNDSTFVAAKSALLFPPTPASLAKLTVRGTRDWVLFHRRRAKVCSNVVSQAPSAEGSRRYQISYQPITQDDLKRQPGIVDFIRTALKGSDITASLTADKIIPFTAVEFGMNTGILKTNVSTLRLLWNQKRLGHRLLYAAMISRAGSPGSDHNLALAQLLNVENALALSFFGGGAPSDVLTNLPPNFGDPADDGLILLIVIRDEPAYPGGGGQGAVIGGARL